MCDSDGDESSVVRELVITVQLPKDVDDDEFVKRLTDLCVAMSRYHRALGGSGLKLDDVKVYSVK